VYVGYRFADAQMLKDESTGRREEDEEEPIIENAT